VKPKAVKRKASGDAPRKPLAKGETKRPPRPRKKATVMTSHTYPTILPGLSEFPSTSQAAQMSAALPLAAPVQGKVVPNLYEGASERFAAVPQSCTLVEAKSFIVNTPRCNNCNTLKCNGPEEAANGAAGVKLQLQLFPLDEHTRKALEQVQQIILMYCFIKELYLSDGFVWINVVWPLG
jgi:hypothetical protein